MLFCLSQSPAKNSWRIYSLKNHSILLLAIVLSLHSDSDTILKGTIMSQQQAVNLAGKIGEWARFKNNSSHYVCNKIPLAIYILLVLSEINIIIIIIVIRCVLDHALQNQQSWFLKLIFLEVVGKFLIEKRLFFSGDSKNVFIKGTVSRDWDVLLVVWMDRALFGDEPLTGFITFCCFLVFNFVFYFSSEVLHKGCPFVCNCSNPRANMP
jgi:hypothetical protein